MEKQIQSKYNFIRKTNPTQKLIQFRNRLKNQFNSNTNSIEKPIERKNPTKPYSFQRNAQQFSRKINKNPIGR